MKERGILFSAPMVRALLAGTKTQTRRLMKPQPELVPDEKLLGRRPGSWWWPSRTYQSMIDVPGEVTDTCCPYGERGDRLWVRETFCLAHPDYHNEGDGLGRPVRDDGRWCFYRATDPDVESGDKEGASPWRPSIFMPRWASRITLEVTSVRVERVQDISEADARAEGVEPLQMDGGSYIPRYEGLWCQINGAGSWAANPWVWVVEFRRIETP